MSEAMLKFNLPEEENEFRNASNAQDMASAIWEFGQLLRKYKKYGLPAELNSGEKVIKSLFDDFYELTSRFEND